MAGPFAPLSLRRPALAIVAAAVIAFPLSAQAQRGPDRIADVAEAVIDAVVNISTSQKVAAGGPSRSPRRVRKAGRGRSFRPARRSRSSSRNSSRTAAARARTRVGRRGRAGSIRSAPAS